nr:uncharacterized protein LOC117605389 [Osmia lignaria]
MNDSSYFKPTFSWEDSQLSENLNDAILLSSNEEILSKSNDDIFYDTTEFSFSSDNNLKATDISNISEAEGYKSCSDLSVSTDSTSMLSLPCPKSNFKDNNVLALSQNSNNLKDQQNVKIYEIDKNVPLRVELKRMFNEILGKHMKELSTSCSTNESDNSVEINDNDPLYQLSKDDDLCPTSENIKDSNMDNMLSLHDTSIHVLNKWCSRDLETILEHSNESSNTSFQQSTSNWSGKCMSELKNLSFQKISKHWIHDKIFITSDIGDSISSETNTSTGIEVISKEIFRELNDLKENDSFNSTCHNENSLHPNEKMIITNNINNEEYNLFKHKVPSILITPATPI